MSSSAAKIIIESMKGTKTVLSLMQLPVTNYSHNESESSNKSDNNSESDGYHSETEQDEQKYNMKFLLTMWRWGLCGSVVTVF